ncbi:MAG: phosphoenolpyruvate--protein phosphotransferase, partial [Clostridia bacterium]|nr:phosphoenolpyruvate--protein phosphotransferase [Clostridia bacterium]
KAKDPLIRERADDLSDVRTRLLRLWFGVGQKGSLAALDRPVIVAAHDLMPSDTATMARDKVLAIITESGGETSHSAILARSYGIPAILGVEGILSVVHDGETVIADAIAGEVITQPAAQELAKYEKKRTQYLIRAAEIKTYLSAKPVTLDGTHIDIELNIGSAQPRELAGTEFTDGVGLFRTEFLYMGCTALPDEEDQFIAYKAVLQACGKKPVIIRTLDAGGDKQPECLRLLKEDNPFLGLRALRLCFDMMPVFKTQLRALLRASVYGNLWIMFPMVGSLGDIRFAKKIIGEVKMELAAQSIDYDPDIKIGIMVEIPSIAVMADIAAEEVDFASIGTNDLCQYLTAVDRLNPKVAKYYQSYHPAMFRLIGSVTEAFKKQGKPVSVCGEMGGDPIAASILIGLGIRKLSMNLSSVASVKKLITGLNIQKSERMAKTVLGLSTAAQVESFLNSEFVSDSPF